MRQIARWILVLALSFSIGLPWAFLQGVAWVGMIVTYAQEVPIVKAVKMTFDGEHPCKMCHAVERGETSQKKQDIKLASVKFELAMPEHDDFMVMPFGSSYSACLIHDDSRVSAEPPVPPPRFC